MSGIKVDPGWLTGYAKMASQGADQLAAAARTLKRTPLEASSFGEIGRTVGAGQAYSSAAATLLGQLTRAGEALSAAAGSLRSIVDEHTSKDSEHAERLKRTHRG